MSLPGADAGKCLKIIDVRSGQQLWLRLVGSNAGGSTASGASTQVSAGALMMSENIEDSLTRCELHENLTQLALSVHGNRATEVAKAAAESVVESVRRFQHHQPLQVAAGHSLPHSIGSGAIAGRCGRLVAWVI